MTRLAQALAFSALLLSGAGRAAESQTTQSQTTTPQTATAQPSTPQAAPEAAHGSAIGAGDTINIVCVQSEEISKSWRVGESGDINLPLIGVVHAAGRTAEQLEGDLVEKLKEYYFVPEVTVYVSEFRSQPVTITGAVEKPGIVQLQGTKTLFDTLMLAGGPKDAGPTVTLTRATSNGEIPWPGAKFDAQQKFSIAKLPLTEVMDGHSFVARLPVHPMDIVDVSSVKQPRLVHVIGEVAKPGAIELVSQNSVSLMKALAVAGGLTRTAQARKTRIMHISDGGGQTESAQINVAKIMRGKAKDLELIPGDVVVVSGSQIMSMVQAVVMSGVSASFYILATL